MLDWGKESDGQCPTGMSFPFPIQGKVAGLGPQLLNAGDEAEDDGRWTMKRSKNTKYERNENRKTEHAREVLRRHKLSEGLSRHEAQLARAADEKAQDHDLSCRSNPNAINLLVWYIYGGKSAETQPSCDNYSNSVVASALEVPFRDIAQSD